MDESGDKQMKESPKSGDKHMKKRLEWILMVSMSPIAFLIFMLMALYGLLRFLCKAALLFVTVAINTPFAVMYNVSNIVFKYNYARLQESPCYARLQESPSYARLQELPWVRDYCKRSNGRGSVGDWNWSDPRANVGIEVKLFVSDFLKVVAGELLLLLSTGIITYYTAPRKVFYISTAVWVVAIFHKWLNSPCLSKTVLSIICDCYGLSPMTFLYSYIGFFDIGCHPIAKCSFIAKKAFIFVKHAPSHLSKEYVDDQSSSSRDSIIEHIDNRFSSIEKLIRDCQINYKRIVDPIANESRAFQLDHEKDSNHQIDIIEELETGISLACDSFRRLSESSTEDKDPHAIEGTPIGKCNSFKILFESSIEDKDPHTTEGEHKFNRTKIDKDPYATKGEHEFNRTEIDTKNVIKFSKWNAFERGLFELSPRIKFVKRNKGKFILKTFMVLKLREGRDLCKYPVERLELPEDYSKVKVNELYNFLVTLSEANGFVTNKMGGRYEHSLTLWEIVEGVQEHDKYEVMDPKDCCFVVA